MPEQTPPVSPEVARRFCDAFNRIHQQDAQPLTPEQLLSNSRGQIGKEGWFCQYGLFWRRGRPILASYCGHRMTNEHYEELAQDGQSVFTWNSWGGMSPVDGHDQETLREYRKAKRRAKKAGIDILPL